MMDLFEAIETRHSYRGEFEALDVPREDLIKIMNAGLAAPSSFRLALQRKSLLRQRRKILGNGHGLIHLENSRK